MPKRSPFTTLCGRLAKLNHLRRADLHVHTIASDGDFTSSQVVAFARQAGLCAVAITDHDTLAGVREAQQSAGDLFEIITGVEISANYAGREVHLLGYFIRLDHSELNARLEQVCDSRRERFSNYIDRLARGGNPIPADRVRLVEAGSASLGRRHVAKLLVACKIAGTQTEAFHRYLGPLGKVVLPKRLIPVQEAIQLVIGAGGVASLAHPSPELADEDFRTLKAFGLDALEAEYPWSTGAPTRHLREIASRFSFAISGGSDCHGELPRHKRIGSCGIPAEQLDRLRALCRSSGESGPTPVDRERRLRR